MIWKQKVLVLLVWLGSTSLGSYLVLRMKPMYRAETLILVESQKIPDKYVASTVIGDVQDRLATISQEILSTTRLKRIIEDYKLYSDLRVKSAFEEVVESMRHDVDVKLEKGWSNNRPGAFRISYQGSDAMVVAAVVNRLASLYIDENLKVREVQAEGTSQFLEAQLNEAKAFLDGLETAVSRYKLQHNGELPQQENSIASALARLQTELQGTQEAMSRAQQNKLMYDAELTSVESRSAAILARPNAKSRPEAVPTRPIPERQTAEMPKNVGALTEYLKGLRSRYSDTHPEVKRAKSALAEALRTEETMVPPRPGEPPGQLPAPQSTALSTDEGREVVQLQQRAVALKAQVEIADQEVVSGAARRDRILREMTIYQDQLRKLPIREQEMAALTRDYEISKANYRSLLDKKLSADMATEMERRQKAERFMVLDPAQVPEKPFKPKRPMLIAISAAAGLALGFALALGREWKKSVLLGEWELPAGVYVLGRIPKIAVMPGSERRDGPRRAADTHPAATTVQAVLCFLYVAIRKVGGL